MTIALINSGQPDHLPEVCTRKVPIKSLGRKLNILLYNSFDSYLGHKPRDVAITEIRTYH